MAGSNSTRRHHSFKDLTGKRFGKWTVLREAINHPSNKTFWTCICECGTEKSVLGSKLTNNRSRSCKPCSKRQHGMRYTMEYGSWKAMKDRCNNPNSVGFQYYGENGIAVCERWKSIENFLADMGPKPSVSHSVDRIEGSKGYSCGKCEQCLENGWPANCRWATAKEQGRNRRTNRLITFNGETLCLTDWSARVRIDIGTLRNRLRKGWSIERALTEPVKNLNRSKS